MLLKTLLYFQEKLKFKTNSYSFKMRCLYMRTLIEDCWLYPKINYFRLHLDDSTSRNETLKTHRCGITSNAVFIYISGSFLIILLTIRTVTECYVSGHHSLFYFKIVCAGTGRWRYKKGQDRGWGVCVFPGIKWKVDI